MQPIKAIEATNLLTFEITKEAKIEEFLGTLQGFSGVVAVSIKTDKFCPQLATIKERIASLAVQIDATFWDRTDKIEPIIHNNRKTLQEVLLRYIEILPSFMKSLSNCTELTSLLIDGCCVNNRRQFRADRDDPFGVVAYEVATFFEHVANATGNLQVLALDGDIAIDKPAVPFHLSFVNPNEFSRRLTENKRLCASDGKLLLPLFKKNPQLRTVSLKNFTITLVTTQFFEILKPQNVELRAMNIQEPFVSALSFCKELTSLTYNACTTQMHPSVFFTHLAITTGKLRFLSLDGKLSLAASSDAAAFAPVLQNNRQLETLVLENFFIGENAAKIFVEHLSKKINLHVQTTCEFEKKEFNLTLPRQQERSSKKVKLTAISCTPLTFLQSNFPSFVQASDLPSAQNGQVHALRTLRLDSCIHFSSEKGTI